MYANTLFVVEEHATGAGIASGLVDLATLGAFDCTQARLAIGPLKVGNYTFTCGMGMVTGPLVVL